MFLKKSGVRVLIKAVVCSLFAVGLAEANANDDRYAQISREIEMIAAETYGPDQPGAAILVTLGDRELVRLAIGQADLELDVPLQPNMVFRIASLSKQFTAAAIMRLQDEGRLLIDDTVGMHLPDYPEHGASITLRQLLNQTSGLNSSHTHARNDLSVEEVIDQFADLPLSFQPDSKFEYNNNNYILLGAIIERVSGQSYGDYLASAFFEPLGMSSTRYDNPRTIIEGRANGYMGGVENTTNAAYVSMSVPYAAGALVSTVDDLLVWNRALFGGDAVSEHAVTQMTAETVEMTPSGHDHGHHDGVAGEYGFGLFVGEVAGLPKYSHSGGIEGFGAYNLYVPSADLSIVILQNSSSWDHPQVLAERFAEIILERWTEE